MSLVQKITDDMKDAMKSKNSATLSTLRLLRSAMKNKQIDVQHELNDEEVLALIKTQVKQLQDSLASFESAGREETVLGIKNEMAVLGAYLPAQMPDDQLEEVIKQVIEQTGATSKQDIGKVMGAAVKAVDGQADGGRIKTVVNRLLPVLVCVTVGLSLAQVSFAAVDLVPMNISQLAAYSYAETGLRIFRVLILWFGIMAVNKILHGGFTFMVGSSRDNIQKDAWGEIATGFVGSIAVVLLYSVTSIVIQVI